MTLCTAYLSREPSTPKQDEIRYNDVLKCDWCDQTYTLDYESSCTDPNDVAIVVAAARKVITEQEHLIEHRDARVEIANTIRHHAA
jgi:hypothetical protein